MFYGKMVFQVKAVSIPNARIDKKNFDFVNHSGDTSCRHKVINLFGIKIKAKRRTGISSENMKISL